MIAIFPSLMAADQLNLETTVAQLEPLCHGFHIDIMDNHFVPNIALSPDTTNALEIHTQKPLFIHLMIDNPETLYAHLESKKGDIIAFHPETSLNPLLFIQTIKEKATPCITITPGIDINQIPYLDQVSHVLIMGVTPGFSGQKFQPETYTTIQEVKKQFPRLTIAVDGGITEKNIAQLARLGVRIFCIGSSIFKATNPVAALDNLYRLAR